ncbi:MAG: hypothetical protein K6G61_11255 [Solobacterium sp.]|nr:hypothetical protein [Solobacterium sp.]
MKTEKTIPVVIGVIAETAVSEKDRDAVYKAVRNELKRLQSAFPASPFILLGDPGTEAVRLCAAAAQEIGIRLLAALPYSKETYAERLSAADRESFLSCCSEAEDVFPVTYTEKVPEDGITDAYLLRQRDLYIASRSHVVLVIRENTDTDAKAYFRCSPVSGMPARTENNTEVIVVAASSESSSAAGTVQYYGNSEAVMDILKKTDDFNRMAQAAARKDRYRLPEGAEKDPKVLRLEQVSVAAGDLSSANARRYRRVLVLLAAAGTLLTFSFLMYDEAEAIGLIFACGIMLVCSWLISRYAERSGCHDKYIGYRALAECTRVQMYLRYAGTDLQAADLLSWTQQDETAWIMCALYALGAGSPPDASYDVRSCWVEEQRAYHEWAAKRAKRDHAISENTVSTALVFSVLLYIAAVLFEILSGGMFIAPVIAVRDVGLYRTALKIVLGTISAVTLFTANYYGKLSLPRLLSDHRKMERFYSRVSSQITECGQTEELLKLLAREELIENANWCSYQRDNKPDINI